MDFFNKTGKMAIASRLRRLTDKITKDSSSIYALYDMDLKPKWFPVFFALSNTQFLTITAIAKEIGQSHPSVSKIIREMSTAGITIEHKDKDDKRLNLIQLSAKGQQIAEQIVDQYTDVSTAIENICQQTSHNLWQAIEEWEYLLSQKSLLKRVKDERKKRESTNIEIIPYHPQYQQTFKTLNEEWISTYFEIEETDLKALDNPQTYIIDNGGYIFVALYKKIPVGVCALIKMKNSLYDFEFAKMAVSPKAQGKNIAYLLSQTALKKAIELGASRIYLESNTVLKPAINLYQKLGFKKIVGYPTPYKRCNIQMELILNDKIDKNN